MTELDGPVTQEGVRVCARECSTCIFRPGNVMHLRGGTVRSMVDAALRDDSAIVCHKTLEGARAICRGFYDRHAGATLMTRLAHPELLGLLEVEAG